MLSLLITTYHITYHLSLIIITYHLSLIITTYHLSLNMHPSPNTTPLIHMHTYSLNQPHAFIFTIIAVHIPSHFHLSFQPHVFIIAATIHSLIHMHSHTLHTNSNHMQTHAFPTPNTHCREFPLHFQLCTCIHSPQTSHMHSSTYLAVIHMHFIHHFHPHMSL